jgi:hypothetical protein
LPALVLNARNDPFCPARRCRGPSQVGRHVTLWQPEHGGHVGFAGGGWPGDLAPCPSRWQGGSTGIASARRAADNPPMDPIVAAALKKWPNVPHCYGWLALDARGDWYMRDDRIQAAGPFPRSRAAGSSTRSCATSSPATTATTKPAPGSFQNGPQRVYVELEAAPYVWRLAAAPAREPPAIASHVGGAARSARPRSTSSGRSSSTPTPATASSIRSTWKPRRRGRARPLGAEPVAFAELPARFGYRLRADGPASQAP